MAQHASPADRFAIEPGGRTDFRALARFHYRAGEPATVVRVLRAIDRERDLLGGVLVVSMPTLNGGWRELAWPGRYGRGDRREQVRRINDELRCISRVVIDPRVRGIGLAVRLVRAYLACPLTPATEAIAQMGVVSPFFERAGMTPYPVPKQARDVRLADALYGLGIGMRALDAGMPSLPDAARAELVRWARSSRTTASLVEGPEHALVERCRRALVESPVAYAHTNESLMHEAEPPVPLPPPDAESLAHGLLVMLTSAERRAVLHRLGRRHADRRVALLRALGIGTSRPADGRGVEQNANTGVGGDGDGGSGDSG